MLIHVLNLHTDVASPAVGNLVSDNVIPVAVVDDIAKKEKRHSGTSKTSKTSKISKTSKASKTSAVNSNGSTVNYDYASDGSEAKVQYCVCIIASYY